MYEANVDDVGYRLVVVYTPIREDGVEGHPVSASTEPVSVGKIFSHHHTHNQLTSIVTKSLKSTLYL